MRTLLQFGSLVSLALALDAAPVFQDGFETGALPTEWTTDITNNGRVAINTEYEPATGQRHLIFDDSESDTVFSVAEGTLRLDLSGRRNVVLAFKAKSLGNESHEPPAGSFSGTPTFDGVSISADQGVTWRTVQSFGTLGTTWESFSIVLDSAVSALGATYGDGFRIRFSEYDNGPAPVDGIAIDDVSVTGDDDQSALVELPSQIVEGSSNGAGYVVLAKAPTVPLALELSASPAGQLNLPAMVTVPAGETLVDFSFSVVDDSLFNLNRVVTVSATSPGVASTPGSITILDDDSLVIAVALPTQLTEGATPLNNATVSIDHVPSVAVTIDLSAMPVDQVVVPASVTIPAGQTQVSFTIRAVEDTVIDGDVVVTVTAGSASTAAITAQTTAVDNESRALSLVLPSPIAEATTATGTLMLAGSLAADLAVTLTSTDEAVLTVPAGLIIPAGQTQATFTINATDNTLRDGSRVAGIGATAPTFATANQAVTIRDNDVASYRFGVLSDLVNVSGPVSATVTAVDTEGNVIGSITDTVNLSVLLPGGTTQPLTPATAALVAGRWTGAVTLPAVSSAPLRLRAVDPAGNSGDSNPFDIMRLLSLKAVDLAWDGSRSRLYASVSTTAGGTYANRVVAIDPSNLQITASVNTNQDPGQLALTSGGEFLYAALNASGSIAKIDPATLTVASTFEVGASPSYGTLYAEDISTVAGQPNLLVVSQYREGVSPRHDGVAAYDNGVMRPKRTQDHTGSNVIEPTADPTIFFGFNNESTEFGVRRLRLDANGMTQLDVTEDLFSGFSEDFRADGDKAFSQSGVQVDGVQMRRLGAFPIANGGGPVRPELAAKRVYFIERQSGSNSPHNKLSAYDPTTFALIRRLTFTPAVTSPGAFIRWGANGLAFRTNTAVVLVNSSLLVPSDPPANLATTVQATPDPASVSVPLTYTVQVTNQGPNPARSVLLSATLSSSQTIQSVTASKGAAATAGATITLPVGDLAASASETLTITTLPQSAGSLTCSASVNTSSVDPDLTNNTALSLVSVGFQPAPDTVNSLRLPANNLIYDSTRNVFWATVPATIEAPLGRSVVSMNPLNGVVSEPIPINADPMADSIALSGNGRYLYIGLSDSPEVHRIDLNSAPVTSLRIPLGSGQSGGANHAQDIEVLDGDGTSFLMAGLDDHAAAVFDGLVRRADRTGTYSVDRIERTRTAGTFIGFNNSTGSYGLTSLSVTPDGVSITKDSSVLFNSYGAEIRGAGIRLLSSTGRLIDSSTLALISNLGVTGAPCLDAPNQRAYLVNGNRIRGFDTATTNAPAAGTLALPVTATGDWAQTCVRWGLDGLAILGNDANIYVVRWSEVNTDTNANGVPDTWEVANLGGLGADLKADPDGDGIASAFEYIHGTLPSQPSRDPAQVSLSGNGGIRLVFPRRAALPPGFYGFESSSDLTGWTIALGVPETVLSTQTVGGVQFETVEAIIPPPDPGSGFARLVWPRP